jgi:hypothetical protein
MRYFVDELEVGAIMGNVSGSCRVEPFGGGLVLVNVDWNDSVLCRIDDPEGNVIVPSESEREAVVSAVRDLIQDADPADGGNGVIVLRPRRFVAA